MWWRRGSKSNEKVKRFACSLRTAGSVTVVSFTVSDCFVTLDMDLLSVCNGLRVKAAPRSPRPTVRKSATRTVCPTRSVTPTPNTCPAPWRQSTGQKPCRHTHTHTQRLLGDFCTLPGCWRPWAGRSTQKMTITSFLWQRTSWESSRLKQNRWVCNQPLSPPQKLSWYIRLLSQGSSVSGRKEGGKKWICRLS